MSNYQTARTAAFKGLNRAPYIADGEMRSMKNLSSDAFPFLTTRKGREPYTFTTYIPSPEGEAYQDIDRLPTPCMEEQGKVYKITTDAVVPEYTLGGYYYYSGNEWVEGRKDSLFEGTVRETLLNGTTLLSVYCEVTEFTDERYVYHLNSGMVDGGIETYENKKVKYLGETNEHFTFGKTYEYRLDMVEAYWRVKGSTTGSTAYALGSLAEVPEASIDRARNRAYFKYTGATTEEYTQNEIYICRVKGYGRWVEVEGCYELADGSMPEAPEEGLQVRYINSALYGAPLLAERYVCQCDIDDDGNIACFYVVTDNETTENTTFLPQATSEKTGIIYSYNGLTTAGEFAKCRSDGNGAYAWTQVEHPDVERTVTLKDYLDNYEGCGMTKLLEIGALNGNLTALFYDGENTAKLYHNGKLHEGINSLTEKSGKKLVTVGNRLIVGESGSYLHEKDGAITFSPSAGVFSYSVEMARRKYQSAAFSGEYVYPTACGRADTGTATFELWSPIKLEKYYAPGENLKELAEALAVEGTGFCVCGARSENSVKQYLKVKSVTYESKKLMGGSNVGEEYADRLYIVADGTTEDFSWFEDEAGKNDTLTFESTDPHYNDVVAWKKRLWGYEKNVLHGTAADIFNDDGVVDWIAGDNTYTESISQPIWQGGNITGITALREALALFKEDSITLVMGNYPAIMSSSTISCRGLSADNRRSVAVANESVFYLSYDGVYKFSGGVPECISRDAKITGTDAVGASDGNKYYLSLLENDGNYAMYVYDISLGLWHKEDDVRIISFVMIDGDMYGATETEIYNLNAPRTEKEWEAEFWYDEGTHRKKKYNGFHIRGKAGISEVLIKADDGEWQTIHWSEDKLDFKFPPIECEELSIKIKGKGICEIKSLDRDYEVI